MRTLWRRWPVTSCAVALVTVCFALQWFLPLVPLLERQGVAIAAGQWWRVLTSFLVQGSGWGQYLFNTAGLVVIGGAVERVRGGTWWIAVALVAQLGTVAIASAWDPAAKDSGSSLVVAGLVGLLTLTRFTAPRWWVLTAAGYRVFFLVYLAGLAVAGPVAGAIAGSVLAGAAVSVLHRARHAPWARRGVVTLVLAATCLLVAYRDVHGVATGFGLLTALVAALVPRAASGRSAAPR